MADEVEIVIRASDRTERAFRDAQGRLRDLRGRFVAESSVMSQAAEGFRRSSVGLYEAVGLLGTALVPTSAATAVLAANVAAAGAAAGTAFAAFGAAIIPQVIALGEASKAQTKYQDAVEASGAASKEATKAEKQMLLVLDGMTPAARETAAGFITLRDGFKAWSDSLSADTLPVFNKSFAVLHGLLPSFSPLVRTAAAELDRFVTIAAGGINTPGFDSFAESVNDLAQRSLRALFDGIVRVSRAISGFVAGGEFQAFLSYARESGPRVAEAFRAIGDAAANLLQASSGLGLGVLSLVTAFSKLIASLPPAFVGTVLELYAAFRLFATVGGGVVALTTAIRGMSASLAGAQAASVGAAGGIAGLRAAIASLSTAARFNLVIAGLTVLAVALSNLGQTGKSAPADIDNLTRSLRDLADTGRMSGEAARVFGEDFGELGAALRTLARPGMLDQVQQGLTQLLGMDSTPVADAKEQLNALDETLTNLAKGGNADLAAELFNLVAAAMERQGMSADELRTQLDGYSGALDDAAFEQERAALAMGLFGEQAQRTQAQLDAQKRSADGLRQAIQDLNDVNRAALDAQAAFEQAVDDAAKAAMENAGALNFVNGQLDLNSQKARDAYKPLRDLAAATDEAAAAARENGQSWTQANRIYERGRAQLIKQAQALGLTRAEAKALADQILKTPDKTARLRGNIEDLERKLDKARKDLNRTAGFSKRAHVRANIAQLEAQLARARARLKSIPDETVYIDAIYRNPRGSGGGFQRLANGGPVGGEGIIGAQGGGPRSALTLVGEQGPELVRLPFGSTVIPAGQTRSMLGGAGGGGGVINMIVRFGPYELGTILVDTMRKEVRSRGGLEATFGSS